MSLGTWTPTGDAAASVTIDSTLIQRCIACSRDGQLDQLESYFEAASLDQLRPLMRLEADAWTDALTALDNDELLHLIRCFTLLEALPDCEAGDRSPVIPAAKLLRKRGQRLEKPLLQWIRENSENRFLPYGPL